MKVLEIAFTCYCVSDVKRSREFYEGLLGLQQAREFKSPDNSFHWVEYDIGASTLAIALGDGRDWKPSLHGTSAALEVDDLDAYAKKVKEGNVTVHMDVSESPVCRMMVIADPDGNRLVLHKRK